METYLEDFEKYMVGERKAAKNTVASYMRDVSCFTKYLALNTCTVKKATAIHIDGFFELLEEKGRAKSTLQRSKAAISAFYDYLMKYSITKTNPVKSIKIASAHKPPPEALSIAEVEKLLLVETGDNFKSIRDRAMIELLYATGIKAGELIALNVADVDTRVGFIRCRGNKAQRVIPVYSTAAKLLSEYISKSRPFLTVEGGESALFVNTCGSRMSRQGFWKLLKHRAQLADINKDITPQIIRHSFAMHLMQNGADLKSLQEMLGHADISTTQIYAKTFNSDLMDKMARFHPRAK